MPEKLMFRDWEESATGEWGPDTGLYRLRDDSPADLARWLWEQGRGVQVTATIELLAHGNPRKAGEFVRALTHQNVMLSHKIRAQYGELANYLFDTPLEEMPSCPAEYPLFDRMRSNVNRTLS